jgi:predicted metal-dependent hydrolase
VSTKSHQIKVSGLLVDVVRKNIKNLHLAVYPPHGRVRVAAPFRVSDEAVRLAVITRLAWIKRQRAKFDGQERQSAREFVTGESHYFQGQRYRLNVVHQNGPARVALRNKSIIDLYVRPGSKAAQREKVVVEWYRRQLKAMIPPLIEKWERIVGLRVAIWGVKRMKTKWGTCTVKAHRIWLNLELVKKPAQCLEYIVVHEMVHLMERLHNDRFTSLMDAFMPQWRLHRDELNRSALRHETWDY